jgi:hypothetical protein
VCNGDEGLAVDRHHCLGSLVFQLWRLVLEPVCRGRRGPYAQDLKICSAIEDYSDQFWHENARDTEELSEKLQANQDEYEKCASKAKLRWESERPSDSMAIAAVLVIDLVTIALGWLIVWGCVALGRWVHRRFAVN